MRVAALDCGTNSLRLLIADIDPNSGQLDEVTRQLRMVRLGQDVDRTGVLAPAALQRTWAALEEYVELIQAAGPERVRFCATAAARSAANADELIHGVHARLGVPAEIISGETEAELSFRGATAAFTQLVGPVLVIDVGGGSTELIVGHPDGVVEEVVSLPAGSVRFTERYLRDDPPTPIQINQLRAQMAELMSPHQTLFSHVATVIGVAGTNTTIAAGVLGLETYQRERVHRAQLQVSHISEYVGGLTRQDRHARAALGYLHPGRVDVIVAGALIVEELLRLSPVQTVSISESDILDGIAWGLATQGDI